MERPIVQEDMLGIDGELEPAGSFGHAAGFVEFLRYIGLRLVVIWLALLLLSHQSYLIDAKQILSHPVDIFAQRIGMTVHSVTVGVLVDLPTAHSFTDLKPQVMRAGRLMGAVLAEGMLDAQQTADRRLLQWVTTDGRGRQLIITGALAKEGQTTLLMELTDWRPGGKELIKDNVIEVSSTAARFGKIQASHVQVQGFVANLGHTSPESWVQPWRLTDLEVTRTGQAVKLEGSTPDLAPGRRLPAAFTLVFVPDSTTEGGGRLSFSVKK
jgi:hypothetical protein